ncbi:MAG TPA: hypothetical protein VIO64_14420 [Pseudobacteroides sp.]|uniref:hypothetical protein n=1 Tax=Pseudobacteroides sp. TaxID=1968840 RepID=UPI002F93BC12
MDSEIVLTSILTGSKNKINSRKILKGCFALDEGQKDIYEIKKIDACICGAYDSYCPNMCCTTGNVKVVLNYISEKDDDNTYNIEYCLPFSFDGTLKPEDLGEVNLEKLSLNVILPRTIEIEACVTAYNLK